MAATLEKPAPIKLPDNQSQSDSEPAAATSAQKTQAPKRKFSLKTIFIAGAIGFFALTLILVNLVRGSRRPLIVSPPSKPTVSVPTPTSVPRPSVNPLPLGQETIYASNPQILQLEGALKNYERMLESIDFRELEIDPPILMMSVNFKK